MKKKITFITLLFLLPVLLIAQGKYPGKVSSATSTKINDGLAPWLPDGVIRAMKKYDVKYHKLELTISSDLKRITSGHVTTRAVIVDTGFSQFVYELDATLHTDSVLVNGTKSALSTDSSFIKVKTNGIKLNDTIMVDIFYQGTPYNNNQLYFSGYTVSEINDNNTNVPILYTLSEPYGAYRWWPCKQDLEDKIDSLDMWITVDTTENVASNGVLVKTVRTAGNNLQYRWKSRHPIAYYLVCLDIYPYNVYTNYAHFPGVKDSMPVMNYYYGNLNDFKDRFDATPKALEYFSTLFGTYPFYDEKYGNVTIAGGGGMENQTMTSLAGSRFDFTAVFHEMGHHWFGDNVTCGKWEDVWLNEGITTYAEYLADNHFLKYPDTSKNGRIGGSIWNYFYTLAMDYSFYNGGSIAQPDTTYPSAFFDGIVYFKGAAMLHSLRYEINNDSVFFSFLQKYQTLYRGKNATTPDFIDLAEKTTGQKFTDFFNQWYYGTGFPFFSSRWAQKNGELKLRINQIANPAIFKTHIDVNISGVKDTTIRVFLNDSTNEFTIPFSEKISGILLDTSGWIMHIGTYCVNDTTLFNGIEKEQNADDYSVSIYPSPASDELHIESNHAVASISIYDISGKRCNASVRETSSSVSLCNIKSLSPGSYIVEVKYKDSILPIRKLFVKQ